MTAPVIAVGQGVSTRVTGVTLLNWPSAVGRVIADYLRRLDASHEKLGAVLVLASPDLLDWAAGEYVAAERAARPTLPTEVLNADGCRAFGRATRLGWSGAAMALSCSPDDAGRIGAAVARTSRARYSVIVEARAGVDLGGGTEGVTFDVLVRSADHAG
ncbi:hypothetical protein [Tsukamurella sp. 1534]|uniref:hypothetical protein n=1 Tax=Tsukamurella sp. 1534 TaxID=1151061 RepID=UPI0002EF3274|nr:hypothetical protein [Tsukamurella sp. 1534]